MILYSRWCALSLVTRNKIAQLFNIPKRGAVEVSSNEIKFDGYVIEDIENKITTETLQDYLKSGYTNETNLATLWEMMVARVEGREETPKSAGVSTLPVAEVKQFKKEHKVRTNKSTVKASLKITKKKHA